MSNNSTYQETLRMKISYFVLGETMGWSTLKFGKL